MTRAAKRRRRQLFADGSAGHVRLDVGVTRERILLVRLSSLGAVCQCLGALAALRAGRVPKGDALAVARIAGIQAAKRTPDLVPLCHPIAIHAVTVDLQVAERAVEISATVRTADRTGVEMEALSAVSVAALTVYDMAKAVDRDMTIESVRLLEKTKG